MSDTEYEDFTRGDVFRFLNETYDARLEEEMSRPRVEIWPDDPYQQWALSHDEVEEVPDLQPSVHEGQSVLRNGIPLESIPFPIVLPRCPPHDGRGAFLFEAFIKRCQGIRGKGSSSSDSGQNPVAFARGGNEESSFVHKVDKPVEISQPITSHPRQDLRTFLNQYVVPR